jgi:hypothetical protein
MINLKAGDLFAYQDEYEYRRNNSKAGLVIEVIGRIHHDIDDVCLTVLIDGKMIEAWQSFLIKLN